MIVTFKLGEKFVTLTLKYSIDSGEVLNKRSDFGGYVHTEINYIVSWFKSQGHIQIEDGDSELCHKIIRYFLGEYEK